ncbi:MAG: polyprenyl synthetase family protein [Firmicutes bacterium]|nr:polyprenyl synthetase family protein [Bacillota bacterium]
MINEYLQKTAAMVEKQLQDILTAPSPREETLFAAMRHSVLAGGKRLRPALFLATMEACGKVGAAYLPFAAALEMIHTYSLIHDDLPAMDNDDWRRGRPTCHKVYGEANAILAGDALLTHAFAVMAETPAPARPLLQAIAWTARQAGVDGMVAGQAADVAAAGQEIGRDLLRYIDRQKTGALFSASIVSGAYLAEAREDQIETLKRYSDLLGYIFQITDDVLDIQGDAALLGKPTGSDAKNAKTTYATLLGCEGAMAYARELAGEARRLLLDWPEEAAVLREMPAFFCQRRK